MSIGDDDDFSVEEFEPTPGVVIALEDIEQAEKDRAYVLRWFDAAKPIKGTLAATYLSETRGIDLDLLPDNVDNALRFHPRCVFGPGTHHPCLLALMRDVRGNAPIGIQRRADGRCQEDRSDDARQGRRREDMARGQATGDRGRAGDHARLSARMISRSTPSISGSCFIALSESVAQAGVSGSPR